MKSEVSSARGGALLRISGNGSSPEECQMPAFVFLQNTTAEFFFNQGKDLPDRGDRGSTSVDNEVVHPIIFFAAKTFSNRMKRFKNPEVYVIEYPTHIRFLVDLGIQVPTDNKMPLKLRASSACSNTYGLSYVIYRNSGDTDTSAYFHLLYFDPGNTGLINHYCSHENGGIPKLWDDLEYLPFRWGNSSAHLIGYAHVSSPVPVEDFRSSGLKRSAESLEAPAASNRYTI